MRKSSKTESQNTSYDEDGKICHGDGDEFDHSDDSHDNYGFEKPNDDQHDKSTETV